MSELKLCKYCGMELSEDASHGLRECHLYAVNRIAELEAAQRELREYVEGLEAESERFTVHSDIERQDDKWIPEVQE